jgi:hypothetical protein
MCAKYAGVSVLSKTNSYILVYLEYGMTTQTREEYLAYFKEQQIAYTTRALQSLVSRMTANLNNGIEITDNAIFELEYTNNKLFRLCP